MIDSFMLGGKNHVVIYCDCWRDKGRMIGDDPVGRQCGNLALYEFTLNNKKRHICRYCYEAMERGESSITLCI